MAIHVSQMIAVDTLANQEAAGTAGRLYLPTTAGSNYLSPTYDNGSTIDPWRANFSIPIITPTGVAVAITTGAAYADIFGGNGSMLLDFTRFRHARLTGWMAIQIGSTSATIKIVDITNTQDITGVVTVNSTTPSRKTTTWANLNSATYGGDASYDAEALQGVAADVLKIYSLQLELR